MEKKAKKKYGCQKVFLVFLKPAFLPDRCLDGEVDAHLYL